MDGDLKFPEGFLWGTATSPTQVEGHVVNEWTDYIASDGGHCRMACNHYHRYEEDVDWMAQLGVNAYRMGIEWSRLQSAPFAPLNPKELARYVHLLDCLKSGEHHADGRAASFFQSAVDFGSGRLAESGDNSGVRGLCDEAGRRP